MKGRGDIRGDRRASRSHGVAAYEHLDQAVSSGLLLRIAKLDRLAAAESGEAVAKTDVEHPRDARFSVELHEDLERLDDEQRATHLRRAFLREERIALEGELGEALSREFTLASRAQQRRDARRAAHIRSFRVGLAIVAIALVAGIGLALSGLLQAEAHSAYGLLSPVMRTLQQWAIEVGHLLP